MIAEKSFGRTDPPSYMFQPLRPGVLETIQGTSGLSYKLVGVVAPAGYGKTVLMSLLFSDLCRKGKQCRWITLDERYSSIDGILSTLGILLDASEDELHPAQALFRGSISVKHRIGVLAELIDHYPLPLTIFIDNLNCCTDAALEELLDTLVFCTQSSVQLVLSSTREIPMNFARASLEGLIFPVGITQLAFGESEVGLLLGSELCSRVGPQVLEDITRHTEGWPAAVRMAQIILGNSHQPQSAIAVFNGSDEGIAHFLNRKVLSGFPEQVREFLLHIAQLRTFSIDLCSSVTGNRIVGEHIEYLLQRNAFIIPLDRNRSWYRLHGLFREFLISEAERALSYEVRSEALKRAALWCEDNGYWRECIDYSLSAKQTQIAIRVLERTAVILVRDLGDIQQYIKWMEALHAFGVLGGAEAEYWFAWALSFCRQYEYARQRCEILMHRVQNELYEKKGRPVKNAVFLRRVDILMASLDSLTDRIQDAHRGAKQWLAEADGTSDTAFNITNATCVESCYFTNMFEFMDARQVVQSAKQAAFQTKSSYVAGWVSAYALLIPIYEGDYAVAYQEMVTALAAARSSLGADASICNTLSIIGAKCAVEMGLETDARQLLKGLESARTHGYLEGVGCGLEAATLLWKKTKEDPIPVSLMRDVAACYPPRLSLMLDCFVIRQLIRLGYIDEADSEAARIGLGIGPRDRLSLGPQMSSVVHLLELLAATEIDLLIAHGCLTKADSLISAEAQKAKKYGRIARLVELDVSKVAVAVLSGHSQIAMKHFVRAIGYAASRRIIRPFEDQSKIISALIYDKKIGTSSFVSRDESGFFGEICQKLQIDLSIQQSLSYKNAEPRLLSKLTPRELELLRLIDSGLSNNELADRTNLTLTTVKWHIHNIYVKLGVTRRTAALSKARDLRLIS